MSEVANEAEAERWNGASGHHWVANRERHRAGHGRLVPHLFRAAGIGPGDRVLDVGCGCGETTVAAARLAAGAAGEAGGGAAGGRGQAFGLDLSATMLAAARQLASEAALPNLAFEQGDAQVYPFPADRYDVAISSFGVMFFGDSVAAFANIRAGVRPGGRLAFLCWQDDGVNELFSIPLRAFAAPPPGPPNGRDSFAQPRVVEDLLARAGWSDVGIEPLSELAWLGSDAADAVDYVCGQTQVRRLIADLGPAEVDAARTAMTREYANRLQPDGVWVGAAAWLVAARRG